MTIDSKLRRASASSSVPTRKAYLGDGAAIDTDQERAAAAGRYAVGVGTGGAITAPSGPSNLPINVPRGYVVDWGTLVNIAGFPPEKEVYNFSGERKFYEDVPYS